MWSDNEGPYQNVYTQGSRIYTAHVTLTLSFPHSGCFSFCCTVQLTGGVAGSGDAEIFLKNTWKT